MLALIGEAPLVLLGEATHGTEDFYETRARLTRRLIEERNFSAVAIEGDWPDALRVSRYVQGSVDQGGGREALAGFTRFPSWMWRNTAVESFVDQHQGAAAGAARRVLWTRSL